MSLKKIINPYFKSDEPEPWKPVRTTPVYDLDSPEIAHPDFQKAMKHPDFDLILNLKMPQQWYEEWDKELAELLVEWKEAFADSSLDAGDIKNIEYCSRGHYINMLKIEPSEKHRQEVRELINDEYILSHCLK